MAAVFALAMASAPPRHAQPVPFKVPPAMPDAAEPLPPSDVLLSGFLGSRVSANQTNRLADVDLEPLLAGFRKRPGDHPWIGEHVGKWMHAATLAWAHNADPTLKKKLDYAAAELIKTQEPDGYLGTYVPEKRFGLFDGADWDVWSHKYCLIGLLTYYQYTGSPDALDACRRIGDLLLRTFGPGRKSILAAGTHMGMAATSVLEPMVLLYRFTGERKYLDFAKDIVESWDEKDGPRILATLTESGSVSRTANGKSYEMLSNLVGLCELARATGEKRYLVPAVNAWDDVVRNHLYITGTASFGEHFHGQHELPNGMGANVGETCVTVTWLQLTHQLFRLTGQARYGEELERSLYNHLAASQRPDGKEWCYYTALEGKKEYGPGISCCVSSGPRGMAMAPGMVYYRATGIGPDQSDRLVVNLFEPSRAIMSLGGATVTVEQATDVPRTGGSMLTFRLKGTARFAVLVRVPGWTWDFRVKGEPGAQVNDRGWMEIPARSWTDGQTLSLEFEIGARFMAGEFGNKDKTAMTWGPLVCAYDTKTNSGKPLGACAEFSRRSSIGAPVLVPASAGQSGVAVSFEIVTGPRYEERGALFVPFAEAGATGGVYRVWIGAPGTGAGCSLLAEGLETRSTPGNVDGSIIDGDPSSFVVTFDGKRHDQEWFAVTLETPVTFQRVVYAHGRTFHDGGWFDTSAGPVLVQARRNADAPWETIGELADDPHATAADPKGLQPGQEFTLKLRQPVTAVAVRVLGRGSCGDNPAQCFASCGELAVFEQ